MAAPLLLLHGQSSGATRAHGARTTSRVAAPGPSRRRSRELQTLRLGYETPLPPTTTTTAPVAPTTTTAPVTPTTAVPAPTTTTTVPVAPARAVVAATNSSTGQATWYAEAPVGGCASPWLAAGTEVEVVNDANGASTSCVVDDREATNAGRVLDLSESGFSQLAGLTQGVITVTISW